MWRYCLQPYIQKYGTDQGDFVNSYDTTKYGSRGVFVCPDQPGSNANYGPTSYGYNAWALTSGWSDNNVANNNMVGLSLAAINRPAEIVSYADAAQINPNGDANVDNGACGDSSNLGPYTFQPELWRESWSPDWEFGLPGPAGIRTSSGSTGDWNSQCGDQFGRRPISRHFGSFNGAFVDGHVKALRARSLNALQGGPQDIISNHN
jgi:prepilin-type processing-associated H-X9-DG protein